MEDMSPALKKRLMMLMMNPEFKGMPMDKLIEEAENQLRQDSFRSKEGPLLEAKDGGSVEGKRLTRTVPPKKGPNSQGMRGTGAAIRGTSFKGVF